MNSHKLIVLCLFLTMVVTACANVATPTPISSPTATSIPAPTLIPITPTVTAPTVEPSSTVDPNMPIAPNGETVQKDAQGNYIYTTVENGNTITWTWTDNQISPEYDVKMWERYGMTEPNGTFLLDDTEYTEIHQSMIPMKAYFTNNSEMPGKFVYVDHPTPNGTGSSFSSEFYIAMAKAIGVKPGMDAYNMYVALTHGNLDGKYDITWTTPDGQVLHGNLAKGYEFHQIAWDQANPKDHPEFHQNGDEEDPSFYYRWAVTVKPDGTIVGYGAVPDITKLADPNRMIMRMVLAPLGEVLTYAGSQIPTYEIAPHFEPSVANFTNSSLLTQITSVILPHFDIVRTYAKVI